MNRRFIIYILIGLTLAGLLSACGRKGAPLPPEKVINLQQGGVS